MIPRVWLAHGACGRARGLIGRSAWPPGDALLLRPCVAIHTFGMRFMIDVVFLDAHNRVVQVVRRLKPWRVAWGGPRAAAALEFAAGWMAPEVLALGDTITWAPASAEVRPPESRLPQF